MMPYIKQIEMLKMRWEYCANNIIKILASQKFSLLLLLYEFQTNIKSVARLLLHEHSLRSLVLLHHPWQPCALTAVQKVSRPVVPCPMQLALKDPSIAFA